MLHAQKAHARNFHIVVMLYLTIILLSFTTSGFNSATLLKTRTEEKQ
jgi:hypothetical protein